MSRKPNAALGRLVLATKCTVVGTLAFTAATLASTTTGTTSGTVTGTTTGTVATEGVTVDQQSTAPHIGVGFEDLMARHACSSTGFGPGVVPASALVLRHGKLRHVSFDDGWDTYTGTTSGTLVAVCQTAV